MAKRNLPLGGATPMEPGERNRRVRIQTVTQGVGASGFPTETPSTLATVWMRRDDQRGDERFAGQQVSAPFTVRWEMGYRADMDPELVDVTTRWLVSLGRRYDITAGSVIGQREGVELMTLARPS